MDIDHILVSRFGKDCIKELFRYLLSKHLSPRESGKARELIDSRFQASSEFKYRGTVQNFSNGVSEVCLSTQSTTKAILQQLPFHTADIFEDKNPGLQKEITELLSLFNDIYDLGKGYRFSNKDMRDLSVWLDR